MSAADTVSELSAGGARAPGSDGERRAARWLARELRTRGRDTRLEPFWCRPNWALAHAWHVALALAGSLLSVSSPRIGGALLLLALLSVIADVLTGRSLGRRLTPERASQNVVSRSAGEHQPVRLVITANYDAGRTGLVYRPFLRAPARRLGGGRLPGWLAWLTIVLAWLLAIAILRLGGATGSAIGVAQLIPTVALVLAFALLLELAGAAVAPGAGDNASGVAVALALARALDVAPPRRLAVDVVLSGAGEDAGAGLRSFIRRHRRRLAPANTIVLGIAPCGAGSPRWWVSDGSFIPLRYHARLRAIAARLATADPALQMAPHRGRGASPALPARSAGLPAITIGRLDERSLAPRSHTMLDTPDGLDPSALDASVQLALMLVDAIDDDLARATPPAPLPAASAA